jgi:hypothetical protein
MVLACPACRTGLVARRGDPLCGTCMKASREMTPDPVWLFDSPLLRQALAAVNLPAVPAIVRAACGLLQRDLAMIVGWSPAALSYYERGARDGLFDIRAALQFADAVGMPRSALLPLVFADPRARQDPAGGTGLAQGAPGGHAVAAGPAAVVPRAVNGSHLRYWRACTDVLYQRGHTSGGVMLLTSARQQWQHVRPAVPQAGTSPHDSQLLAVAAELALCVAQIALDAGHPQLARHLHAQARALAGRAPGTMLTVHTLADESLLAAEQAHAGPSRQPARHALRLAFQAQEESRYLPVPRLHTMLALRHATAAALLSDHAAFAAAIRQARRELDRGHRDDNPPAWLRNVTGTQITATEADGYLTLGDPYRSAQLYQQLLAADLSPRSRAACTAGLASALLCQGAAEDAITIATQTLPAIQNGTAPARSYSQLRTIRDAATTIPAARDFRDRYDTIHHTPVTTSQNSGTGTQASQLIVIGATPA